MQHCQPAGLPGVSVRLDVDAPNIMHRVFHELDRLKLPYTMESAQELDFVSFDSHRGKWTAARMPDELRELMRLIR